MNEAARVAASINRRRLGSHVVIVPKSRSKMTSFLLSNSRTTACLPSMMSLNSKGPNALCVWAACVKPIENLRASSGAIVTDPRTLVGMAFSLD